MVDTRHPLDTKDLLYQQDSAPRRRSSNIRSRDLPALKLHQENFISTTASSDDLSASNFAHLHSPDTIFSPDGPFAVLPSPPPGSFTDMYYPASTSSSSSSSIIHPRFRIPTPNFMPFPFNSSMGYFPAYPFQNLPAPPSRSTMQILWDLERQWELLQQQQDHLNAMSQSPTTVDMPVPFHQQASTSSSSSSSSMHPFMQYGLMTPALSSKPLPNQSTLDTSAIQPFSRTSRTPSTFSYNPITNDTLNFGHITSSTPPPSPLSIMSKSPLPNHDQMLHHLLSTSAPLSNSFYNTDDNQEDLPNSEFVFDPNDDRKFACETCSRRFLRKHDMLRHRKLHAGEKIACGDCGNCLRGRMGWLGM
ncbi:hypothetical protein BC829DRAFT_396707 [Chytridium lagenaria]|nr:hypothetical protein BC829DRAFT_396707 [Chytridium lagenaria]